ncbi:VIR protein [Plasmodium vivax]|uniref:VIR protein n=1 Tax=Plasmodium vivax TaxID=5855 RepID=A0A1G4E585_PLAVI|nr:VIR protein [Plasmodium vivax]SCA81921.1 VIR protein [Plasmodium vivax]VUZ97282.1 PIR protein [Plasmodium vivax]
MPKKPEALQAPKRSVGRSIPPGTVESSVIIAETMEHNVPGNSTMEDSVVQENNDDSPIRDMPNKAGTVGATLAGSSYTPFGSWVSTKVLGRNKLMENMNKNNYDLILNDVGNHESSINDTMYHIRYNSVTNH